MHLTNKVLVIDDFYKDPDKIRNFALNQEYKSCTDPEMGGNWPGLRSRYLHNLDESLVKEFRNNLIENLLEGIAVSYNCYFETSFQLCYESIVDSWIHTDTGSWPITHVGVIYLNPHPVENSGTNFYKLKNEYINDFQKYAQDNNSLWTKLNRDEDSEKFNQWFDMSLSVSNVYNRAVIYSPNLWHKSDRYFGNSINTGRLTQVFFANIRYE